MKGGGGGRVLSTYNTFFGRDVDVSGTFLNWKNCNTFVCYTFGACFLNLLLHLLKVDCLRDNIEHKNGFCSGRSYERNDGRKHEEESGVYVRESKNPG